MRPKCDYGILWQNFRFNVDLNSNLCLFGVGVGCPAGGLRFEFNALRWRRHKFEFNSTLDLVPVWREHDFDLISHGFRVLSSDLKPLSNARVLFEFNPAAPTAA